MWQAALNEPFGALLVGLAIAAICSGFGGCVAEIVKSAR